MIAIGIDHKIYNGEEFIMSKHRIGDVCDKCQYRSLHGILCGKTGPISRRIRYVNGLLDCYKPFRWQQPKELARLSFD